MQVSYRSVFAWSLILSAFIVLGSIVLAGVGFLMSLILIFVAYPALVLVFTFLFGFLSVPLGINQIADPTNIREGEEESEEESVPLIVDYQIRILDYGEVIGNFNGSKIYEYLKVQIPESEGTMNLLYKGPVDLENGFKPGQNVWFIILDDILYLEHKENLE